MRAILSRKGKVHNYPSIHSNNRSTFRGSKVSKINKKIRDPLQEKRIKSIPGEMEGWRLPRAAKKSSGARRKRKRSSSTGGRNLPPPRLLPGAATRLEEGIGTAKAKYPQGQGQALEEDANGNGWPEREGEKRSRGGINRERNTEQKMIVNEMNEKVRGLIN